MVSSLRRRRRRKKDAIKGKERSSDIGTGDSVRQCRLPAMNVTMTGAALLGLDALQVPATLALPSIPVATVIATTVVIRLTLRAGMDIVVIVQTHVTGDDKGTTVWTLAAVVLLMNGDLGGRARTSLILTSANDGVEVVVTLLT
jgi:hypothetical protein